MPAEDGLDKILSAISEKIGQGGESAPTGVEGVSEIDALNQSLKELGEIAKDPISSAQDLSNSLREVNVLMKEMKESTSVSSKEMERYQGVLSSRVMGDVIKDTKMQHDLMGKTSKEKKEYIKEMKKEADQLKKAGVNVKGLNESLDDMSDKSKSLGEDMAGGIADMFGGMKDAVGGSGRDMNKAFMGGVSKGVDKLADVLPPGWGMAVKAIKAGFEMWIAFSAEMTASRRDILAGASGMRDFNASAAQIEKSAKGLKVVESLFEKMGGESENLQKRLDTLVNAGFRVSEEGIGTLFDATVMLKEGLGLSDAAIGKFATTLKKEYNLTLTKSVMLMNDMARQADTFNVSGEEMIQTQLDIVESGRDYGLSLKTVQREMDEAAASGLSWSQAIRQVSEVAKKGQEMGMEKQAFLAQRLGLATDDVFAGIEKIRLGAGGKLGDRMMEEVAKMAGVKGGKGGIEGGDVQKFALFAQKTFDISREVAETWARGGKAVEQQTKSLQVNQKVGEDRATAEKRQLAEMRELIEKYKEMRGWTDKASDGLSSFWKRLMTGTTGTSVGGGIEGGDVAERNKIVKTREEAMKKSGFGGAGPSFFNSGGKVQYYQGGRGGGPMGTDTVPAWLTPGEVVIPEPMVNAIKSNNFQGSAEGGGGPGGSLDINIDIPGAADLEMALRDVIETWFNKKVRGLA